MLNLLRLRVGFCKSSLSHANVLRTLASESELLTYSRQGSRWRAEKSQKTIFFLPASMPGNIVVNPITSYFSLREKTRQSTSTHSPPPNNSPRFHKFGDMAWESDMQNFHKFPVLIGAGRKGQSLGGFYTIILSGYFEGNIKYLLWNSCFEPIDINISTVAASRI